MKTFPPTKTFYQHKTNLSFRNHEFNCRPSQTIPGEAKTINQLLLEYSHGKIPQDPSKGVYLDVEKLEEIGTYFQSDLDLTDLENLKNLTQSLKQTLDDTEKAIQYANKQKQAKELEQLRAFKKANRKQDISQDISRDSDKSGVE